MNKRMIFFLSAMLSSVLLGGCQFAPGSSLTVDKSKVVNPLSPEEEANLLRNVAIYKITPKLLEDLHLQQHRQEHSQEALRLRLNTNTQGYQYRLASGDVLSVKIWGASDLQGQGSEQGQANSSVVIDANGNIYFPYVGTFHVADKTVAQVRRELTQRLANYLRNPQLDVNVLSYQSKKAYVTGEVNKPGMQAITNTPLTVLDAINRAGGMTDHAVWGEVTLNRSGERVPIPMRKLLQDGDLSYNYLLQNGDILNIPRDDKYQIMLMGEVGKQQNIRLGRYGTTLSEALGSVGGINEYSADATGIFVIRNHKNVVPKFDLSKPNILADIYQLDMRDATALALGNKFELQPGDIVYVTAVPIARWNRVISNLMPSVSGLNSIRRLAN